MCDSRVSALSEAIMSWRRGQAYGQDLRDRVLACRDLTLAEAAARFGVSRSYVSKVRARFRELGDASPGPQHNHVPLRLAPLLGALRAQIKARPDTKLRELRAWLESTHGVRVSHPVMWKVVTRLGLTLKRTSAGRRAGPRGHRRGAAGLGRASAKAGPQSLGVPRRDVGDDQHVADTRLGAQG
jgi:transposase